MTGLSLNGESQGGVIFGDDVDGHGDTDDPTALGVDGGVRSLRVGDPVGGDVYFGDVVIARKPVGPMQRPTASSSR